MGTAVASGGRDKPVGKMESSSSVTNMRKLGVSELSIVSSSVV